MDFCKSGGEEWDTIDASLDWAYVCVREMKNLKKKTLSGSLPAVSTNKMKNAVISPSCMTREE